MSIYLNIVLQNLIQPINILVMLVGVSAGIIVGALPGLSATLAVALALPFTFSLPPETGLLLLIGVYCAAIYGGSITAVLIKTPGTPASAVTAIDGYALTKQGKSKKALMIALWSSVLGGLISGFALLFISPFIAKFALNFGPPEYFALTFFGLSIISVVSGASLSKGMVMAAFGLFFSTVGIDAYDGLQRFTFGQTSLLSGINVIPVLIGAFAVAEVMNQIEIKSENVISSNVEMLNREEEYSWKKFLKLMPTVIRSSIIGIIIGATPGTGCGISSALSYNVAAGLSKKPEDFGNGSEEGICASEAGNNAATGATLIPALTLGIPGDTTTAVMLGALTIHGLKPGPMLFKNNGAMVYTVILGFFVVNILMFFLGKIAIVGFSQIIKMSLSMLMPIVVVLCLLGSFAYNNTLFGVILMIFFGIFGYILNKFDFPMVPLIIALVLGSLVDVSLRQSLIMSHGSFGIFFSRPISLVFMMFGILTLVFAFSSKIVKKNIKA